MRWWPSSPGWAGRRAGGTGPSRRRPGWRKTGWTPNAGRRRSTGRARAARPKQKGHRTLSPDRRILSLHRFPPRAAAAACSSPNPPDLSSPIPSPGRCLPRSALQNWRRSTPDSSIPSGSSGSIGR
eukprot:scaffold16625_cov56-Isochrysis_galbana.AAC.1